MNIHPAFTLTCTLLTAAISITYVIWVYLDSNWAIKVVLSSLLLITTILIWFSMQKKTKISVVSSETVWQEIQLALKDLEQTGIYVLTLDTQSSMQLVCKNENIIYIRIANPEHLLGITSYLFEHHAAKTLSLCVELSIYPTLSTTLSIQLKDYLRNLLFLQKHFNFTVPVNLVIHGPENLFYPQSVSQSGFTLKHQARQQESNIGKLLDTFQEVLALSFLNMPSHISVHYNHYFRASQVINSIQDIFYAQADSGWSYVNIRSVTLIADSIVHPYSLWMQSIYKTTGGLVWPQSNAENMKYIDTSILHLNSLDTFYRKNILLDLIIKLLSIIAMAFIVAVFCSATNNQFFLKQIHKHITSFKTSTSSLIQRQSKEELQRDLEILKTYQLKGEPIRLGLGLYHGEILISKIEYMLNKSTLLRPQTIPQKKSQPVVLTLDSLALFETGQYELKYNANKALIGILKTIEQHPETQIIVEGHTDNIGNPTTNQQLSEKRALAVRDWLVISSNLPATRFAVKGYGDTRPISENATEKGRAQNRRVEIILIPNAILPTQ